MPIPSLANIFRDSVSAFNDGGSLAAIIAVSDIVRNGTSAFTTGGSTVPAFSDAFSLKTIFGDTNAAANDATSFGFTFPETNAALTDLTSFAFTFPETNAGLTDAFDNLRFGLADSNAVLTDNGTYAITFTQADSNAAMADAINNLNIRLAETNATQTETIKFGPSYADSNAVLTDAGTYSINLLQADTNATQSETVQMKFPAPDFADSNIVPTEARSMLVKGYLNGSTGTSGNVTSPTNADGLNNGTVATLATVALGATQARLTSLDGNNLPSIVPTAVTYRGWFKVVNVLGTSTNTVIAHSSTAAFADITVWTGNVAATTYDFLTTPLTFDLFAAGVDTAAKLTSLQFYHTTTDAVAGVSPTTMTVDAGVVEATMVL